MAQKILASMPGMTDQQLDQLEFNALERRHGPKAAEAAEILTAVIEERSARKAKALAHQANAINLIKERVANMTFQERVEAAFTEALPADWERAALNVLAENPDATTEELSAKLGYSDTYMNWFGMVCADRQPWLGPAVRRPDGKLIYSDLLCKFTPITDPKTGRTTTQWKLKDEALAALKRSRIVK
jgi:hypothetical protein